ESLRKGGCEPYRGRILKPPLRFFVRDCTRCQSSGRQTGDFMVKIAAVFVLVLLFAVPLRAQDDYPRIQTSLGYANLNFLDYGSVNFPAAKAHHSGFANETGFNFTRNLGVTNYMGVYGLGGNVTMIADFI